MTITPETLAAYADGELFGTAAQEVEAAMASDPDIARQVEAHRALRARLSAHFAPIADQPVPESLRKLLTQAAPPQGTDVVDMAAAREQRARRLPRWTWIAAPALAASFAALFFDARPPASDSAYAEGTLASALDTRLTADGKSDVRVLLSFRDAGGRYCRGYAAPTGSGIACRDGRGWRVEKRFGTAGDTATEYRQAGSQEDLFTAAQEMAAGPALDAAEEAAARDKGWR